MFETSGGFSVSPVIDCRYLYQLPKTLRESQYWFYCRFSSKQVVLISLSVVLCTDFSSIGTNVSTEYRCRFLVLNLFMVSMSVLVTVQYLPFGFKTVFSDCDMMDFTLRKLIVYKTVPK